MDFLTHSLPIVVIVWFVALAAIRLLFRKELSVMPETPEAVLELKPHEALKDSRNAIRVLVIIGVAVLLFLLEELLHITPAFIALAAATVGLAVVQPDIKALLKKIEWDVLVFFVALFVMVGGMEQAGLMDAFASLFTRGQGLDPMILGLIVLWLVAIASAFIDNIPITIALIRSFWILAPRESIPTHLWALAFGAGLAGTALSSARLPMWCSFLVRTHRHPYLSHLDKRGLRSCWRPVLLPVYCMCCFSQWLSK